MEFNQEEDKCRRLIFVVGNSRSGTTMVSSILGLNSQVFSFGELHFFEQLWSPQDRGRLLAPDEARGLTAALLRRQREGIHHQSRKTYDREVERILAEIPEEQRFPENIYKTFLCYESQEHRKDIPCEHTGQNIFYLREILDLFPDSRIVNMVRDPRDVLVSQKRRWKRRFLGGKRGIPFREAIRDWFNYNPLTISQLWKSGIEAAKEYSRDCRVLMLKFEDLLEDPDKQLTRLCDFIGLPYERSMLEVPHIGSSSGRDNPSRKGINQDRTGSWQNGGLSPTEVYICQKITRNLMQQYGYKISDIQPNPVRLVFYMMTFPWKILIAFILNLKRMKNVKETFKRRLRYKKEGQLP